MAKRVKKRSQAKLASPEFRDRSEYQHDVLVLANQACDKLSQKRRQFILDIADMDWLRHFSDCDDELVLRKEARKWDAARKVFLKETTNPLELHFFSCNWNCDRGVTPLLQVVKNSHCDAGTAMRLYWLNDPYYYQDYRTISDCPDGEEQDMLRILRTIERRFKRADFATKRIPFDPTPWIEDESTEAIHETPAEMRQPITTRRKK